MGILGSSRNGASPVSNCRVKVKCGACSTCWEEWGPLVAGGKSNPGYPPVGTDREAAPVATVQGVGGDIPAQGIVVPTCTI